MAVIVGWLSSSLSRLSRFEIIKLNQIKSLNSGNYCKTVRQKTQNKTERKYISDKAVIIEFTCNDANITYGVIHIFYLLTNFSGL